jgi:hypothetical protein
MITEAEPEVVEETEVDEVHEQEWPIDTPSSEPAADVVPLGELEREHYERIKSLSSEAQLATLSYEQAKAEAGEAKKYADKKHAELVMLIQRGPDRQRPLFNEPDEPKQNLEWREAKIEGNLDVPDSMAAKLAENGIETLGQLQDFWTGGRMLTEFKGIGEEKAARVSDAYHDYMREHPEYDLPSTNVEASAEVEATGEESDEESE